MRWQLSAAIDPELERKELELHVFHGQSEPGVHWQQSINLHDRGCEN